MRPALAAVGLALGTFGAGLVTGVATLFLHSHWWGLGLAIAATLAGLAALSGGWWSRVAFAVGWELPVLAGSLGAGPGGDVLVTTDPGGYALLVFALVVALVALLTLPARGRGGGHESDDVGSSA